MSRNLSNKTPEQLCCSVPDRILLVGRIDPTPQPGCATLFFGDGACDHFEVIVLFIHLGKHHDISFDTLLTGQTTLSRKVLQHGRGQFLA